MNGDRGAARGVGQPNGGRRRKNRRPCKSGGPGYGRGGGRGQGRNR